MARKLYNWYFKQKVTKTELANGFTEVRGYTKDFIADHLTDGFLAVPTLTEHSPSPDFTVDVNIPLSGAIIAYNNQGQTIRIPGSQNVDLTDAGLSGGPVTLPGAGNQKYVLVLVGYSQSESDPRTDGDGLPVNYVLEDSFVFSIIQGAEAATGSAVVPSDPGDGRLIIGKFLLSENTTQITNSLIDQDEMKRVNLNDEVQGFDAKEMTLNAGARGVPSANYEQHIILHRGSKPAAMFRLLEGADPNTDSPILQLTDFTDSDNFVWSEMATLANVGWTRTPNGDIELTNTSDHVGVGVDPDPSAKLHVGGTTGGFLVPVVTTVQRDAIPSPASGLLIYNSDVNVFQYWNGATWDNIGAGGSGGGEITYVEYRQLDATDISNGYRDLVFEPSNPDNVRVEVVGVTSQVHSNPPVDFDVIDNGSGAIKRVSWAGLGMAAQVSAGTWIRMTYAVGNPGTLPVAASNVSVNTGSFSGNLGPGDTDVQVALQTLDGALGGATTAAGTSVDTSNFDKNLSASDVNVQLALDTLDELDSAGLEAQGAGSYIGTLMSLTAGATQEDVNAVLDGLNTYPPDEKTVRIIDDKLFAGDNEAQTRLFEDFLHIWDSQNEGASSPLLLYETGGVSPTAQIVGIDSDKSNGQTSGVITYGWTSNNGAVSIAVGKFNPDNTSFDAVFRVRVLESGAGGTLPRFFIGLIPNDSRHGSGALSAITATDDKWGFYLDGTTSTSEVDIQVRHAGTDRYTNGNVDTWDDEYNNYRLSWNHVTQEAAFYLNGSLIASAIDLSAMFPTSEDWIFQLYTEEDTSSVDGQINVDYYEICFNPPGGRIDALATPTLTGSVTSSAGGPVSGVGVTVNPGGFTDTTGADGKYTVTGMTDGNYTVDFTSATHVDETGQAVTIAGLTTFNNTLTANSVSGNVTSDTTGAAIAGAAVAILSAADSTDGAGDYDLFKVQEGSQTITASATGFDPYSAPITVAEGSQTSNFTMVAQEQESGISSLMSSSGAGIATAGNGRDVVGNRITLSKPLQITGYRFTMGDSGQNFSAVTNGIYFQVFNSGGTAVIQDNTDLTSGDVTTALSNGAISKPITPVTLPAGDYVISIYIVDSGGVQNDIARAAFPANLPTSGSSSVNAGITYQHDGYHQYSMTLGDSNYPAYANITGAGLEHQQCALDLLLKE